EEKTEKAEPCRVEWEQDKYCKLGRAAPAALRSVEILFSTAVTDVRQSADTVEVEATSQSTYRVFTATYAVGADGARSSVRKSLGIELSGDIYPETTILATTLFPFHERLEGLSNVSYCWKPDGTFSLLRLPGVWRASLFAADR